MKIVSHLKQNQSGFTMVEMLIALAIVAVVSVAISVTILHVFQDPEKSNQRLEAINNVQNAADWISRDARNAGNAETVTFDSDNCPTFTWYDYGYDENSDDADAHKTTVRYYYDGDKLMREYTYGN